MAAEVGAILLKVAVMLVAAKAGGELFERFRQPAVLGELLAGVLLGPTLLGYIDFSTGAPGLEVLRFAAELGVILLLFQVGLETRLKDMMSVGASSAVVALLGIVGSFAAGLGVSWALGSLGFWSNGWLFHIFVGATFTATSVGITARVLSDLGRLATPEARIILGAAVLDDIGGLLVLAFVVALAAGAVDPSALALQGAMAIGFLVVAVGVGLKVMPWVADRLAALRSRGALTTLAVAFALVLAFLAEGASLAAIIGAFAAGVILASTRQQKRIEEGVRHLGDVFVPLFFVYVGLQVDLRGIGDDAGRLAFATVILTLVAVAGKLIAAFGVLEKGLDRLAVGVGMVPRGEVGLIFALVGLTTLVDGVPLVQPWEYTAILLVVALTTFMTPLWLRWLLARHPPAAAPAAAPSPEDRAQA